MLADGTSRRRRDLAVASIVAVMVLGDAVDESALKWNAPSPRLRVLRHYEVTAGTLLAVIAGGVVSGVVGVSTAVALVVMLGLLAAGALADAVAGRRVRAWAYAERADDLLVCRGVMFRRTSVIPYGRMQYVEVTAGPFERAFRLATVQMHTAAAASDARIPGLPAAEAARLRDQLTSLGEAKAMGL